MYGQRLFLWSPAGGEGGQLGERKSFKVSTDWILTLYLSQFRFVRAIRVKPMYFNSKHSVVLWARSKSHWLMRHTFLNNISMLTRVPGATTLSLKTYCYTVKQRYHMILRIHDLNDRATSISRSTIFQPQTQPSGLKMFKLPYIIAHNKTIQHRSTYTFPSDVRCSNQYVLINHSHFNT